MTLTNEASFDDLTFNNLEGLIPFEMYTDISIMATSSMEKPWLVNILLYTLSDSNPGLGINPVETIKEVAELLIRYYNDSWSAFFDISSGSFNIEKMVEFTQQDRFLIEAANGIRVATSAEVEEGIFKVSGDQVIELINEPTLKLEESEYKFINLFTWTVTGKWRYYIRAGYKCEYIDNRLKEPEVRYITRISNVLFRMCELLRSDTYYASVVDKIKRIKKAGSYKYPSYASDEVHADEKFLFIVNQMNKIMPRNKTPLLYECSKILWANKSKSTSSYSTQDKVTLRKGYYYIKNPDKDTTAHKSDDAAIVAENKAMCDKIRKGVADGYLSDNEFAIKIVGTICRNGYRYCSEKQKNIILAAISKIDAIKAKQEQTQIIEKAMPKAEGAEINTPGEFSLASMSDLLGKGLM